MLKVKFLLRKKDEDKEIPIHVRITDGRDVDVWGRTKEVVLLENWDSENGFFKEKYIREVKGKMVEKRDADTKNQIAINKEANNRLLILKNTIENLYKSNTTEIVNTNWLKNVIHPPIKKDDSKSIIPNDIVDYIDFYVESKGVNISDSLKSKVKTIKKILDGLKKKNRISSLLIENINVEFQNEFEKYCLSLNYAPNYTSRNLKFIKTICYHAEANGIKIHSQLKSLRLKTEKTDIIYLTFDELDIIENTPLPHDYLENAKDWLIISCFTGQRVSDFLNFTKDKIRIEKGKSIIEFTQKKTQKLIAIPLHKRVQKILDKRDGDFPRKISSQKYNTYIKEVCEIAGINEVISGGKQINQRKVKGKYPKFELISTHVGRRSFASNFFGEIPNQYLMAATGHSTERMFLKYIGKTSTEQSLALAEYF
ncbi:MAG: phage integrase SAM-like domain-containing protein [Moheibacter sp.]